jgi:hypothetical protein
MPCACQRTENHSLSRVGLVDSSFGKGVIVRASSFLIAVFNILLFMNLWTALTRERGYEKLYICLFLLLKGRVILILSLMLDQYLKENIKSVKFLSQSYSRHDLHICRRRPTFPSPDESDLQAEDSLITCFSSTLPLRCHWLFLDLHSPTRRRPS